MCKRVLVLMLLAAMCVCGNLYAQEYTVSGVDGVWSDSAFWGGTVPVAGDRVILQDSATVTIDGTTEQCDQLEIASYNNGTDLTCTLNIINGASLEVFVGSTYNGWTWIGNRPDDIGIINVGPDSTYIAGSALNVGYKGKGILNVDGGAVIANGGIYVSNPWTSGDGLGVVNLMAGSITANEMAMKETGYIDITGGTFTLQGEWWATDGTFLGHIDNNRIVAYGGAGTLDVQAVDGNTVINAIHPYQPNPENGGTTSAGVSELSWLLPDPNLPDGDVSCTVYISDTFEGKSIAQGDPNFPTYADKVVDADSVEAVTVTLEGMKNYYWRIDINDSSSEDPIIGDIFTFNTMNMAPVVNAGDDIPSWLVDGSAVIDITGSVDDDGQPEPYTVQWELVSEPAEGATTITSELDEEILSVSLTELGDYEFKLTADDGELTGSDTVIVSVYTDNCEAAKGSGVELLDGDINEDCVVDLVDLAAIAANWLGSIAL